MHIRFGFEIKVSCAEPVSTLLALSVHPEADANLVGSDHIRVSRPIPSSEYVDFFGNRITRIVAPKGDLTIWSDCIAEVDGKPDVQAPDAAQLAIEDLPSDTLTYLMPSRYCESDKLGELAWDTFGGSPSGWARVQAICDFVHHNTTFGYKFSSPTKTAHDVVREKTGVCRDFAHLAIALCRAMNIPARYASGYLGDIGVPDAGPGDFCAWFEVFLGGRWYTFDARYNTPRIGRILMVRGRDAADVAMLTSFGAYTLEEFRVWTDEAKAQPEGDILQILSARPDAQALSLASSGRMN